MYCVTIFTHILLFVYIRHVEIHLTAESVVDTSGQSHFSKVYPKSKWDSPLGYFIAFVNFYFKFIQWGNNRNMLCVYITYILRNCCSISWQVHDLDRWPDRNSGRDLCGFTPSLVMAGLHFPGFVWTTVSWSCHPW